jgi:hypothetical protein
MGIFRRQCVCVCVCACVWVLSYRNMRASDRVFVFVAGETLYCWRRQRKVMLLESPRIDDMKHIHKGIRIQK